jgi:signal transduction histidine kinase/ActR/RegA family two-component response regulator
LPVTLLSAGNGQLWLSTLSDGIFRYRCAVNPKTGAAALSLETHYAEGSGLPPRARRPILTAVGSQIVAFTETEILRFSAAGGFIPAPEFAGWIGMAAAAPFPSEPAQTASADTAYWIVQRQALGPLSPYSLLHVWSERRHGEILQWDPWRLNAVDGSDEVTGVDVTTDASGTFVWIGRKQGFLQVSPPAVEAIEVPQPLQMRGVTAGGTQHFDLLPAKALVLSPQVQSLRFDFSPNRLLELGPAFYQTRLRGVETDWSGIRTQSTAEFTGLAPGSYRFEARQIDQYGRAGPTLGYGFTLEAPWYRHWPAQAGFLALAAAGVGYFVRRRLQHLHDRTVKLDRLVAERTRELEMSNAAKSEFLDSISHEIRNPLNGIVGLIALLDETGTGDVRRELGRSLKECAAGLSQVFNEVLNFSRLESGQVEIQARPFRLAELLASVRAMFLDAAVQHGSSVEIELPPDFADGWLGDEAKIRTILNNFLGNALKYAPGTPVTIAVTSTEREDGQAAIMIEVSDQGPGVPDEEQELIFKKFARGAQARQSDILGTGIGLATCRALAKELGGSVGIESPNAGGRGSTFFLRLILRPTDQPAAAEGGKGAGGWNATSPSAEALAKEGRRAEDLAGFDRRALVVDDKSYNQLVLASILQQLGYRMEIVDTGAKALASFAQQPFETVFLDLDLPGMTGPEIARELRRQPGGVAAVIIGTSGRSSAEVAQRCREAGMDSLVTKPLTAQAIEAALQAARANV